VSRFILRYRGQGAKPTSDVARLRSLPGVSVIDDSSPRMVLVEAPEEALRRLVEQTHDWVMSHEQTYHLPTPHPSLDKARRSRRVK
jgi:hypothetical protein